MILLYCCVVYTVLVIAKYQYQSAFVADQEINMLACLTEIMVECEFKRQTIGGTPKIGCNFDKRHSRNSNIIST